MELAKVDAITMIAYLALFGCLFLIFVMKLFKFMLSKKKFNLKQQKFEIFRSNSASI